MTFTFDLQRFAHKKGVSSTRNGRDSESKRLGVKEQAGTLVSRLECRNRQGRYTFCQNRRQGRL